MRQVIKHLKCNHKARIVYVLIPLEEVTMQNLYRTTFDMASQPLFLLVCQSLTDFDDAIAGARIYVWLFVSNVVKDVFCQCTCTATQFIHHEFMIGEKVQLVFCYEITRKRTTVMWTEQLRRSMPHLTSNHGVHFTVRHILIALLTL